MRLLAPTLAALLLAGCLGDEWEPGAFLDADARLDGRFDRGGADEAAFEVPRALAELCMHSSITVDPDAHLVLTVEGADGRERWNESHPSTEASLDGPSGAPGRPSCWPSPAPGPWRVAVDADGKAAYRVGFYFHE